MARYILPLLLVLSGCSIAPRDDWTRRDTMLEVGFQVANALDAYSTSNIQDTQGVQEVAPLTRAMLGPEPSTRDTVMFFATYGVVHYLISRWLTPEARPWYQGTTLGLSGASAVGNCNKDLC